MWYMEKDIWSIKRVQECMGNCLSSSYQASSGFRKEGKVLLMLSFTGHGLASWK
jgi:hypothetical protein